jgi:hypothetical protein
MTGWLAGADIAGKWKATFELQDGPVEVTYDFRVDGEKFSGAVTSSHGDGDVIDGKIQGDTVQFAVTREERKVAHKGTVNGDEMKLEVTIGERIVAVVARRVRG